MFVVLFTSWDIDFKKAYLLWFERSLIKERTFELVSQFANTWGHEEEELRHKTEISEMS